MKCEPLLQELIANNIAYAGSVQLSKNEVDDIRFAQRQFHLSQLGVELACGKCTDQYAKNIAISDLCVAGFPERKFDFPLQPRKCKNIEVGNKIEKNLMTLSDRLFEEMCQLSSVIM